MNSLEEITESPLNLEEIAKCPIKDDGFGCVRGSYHVLKFVLPIYLFSGLAYCGLVHERTAPENTKIEDKMTGNPQKSYTLDFK